MNRNALSLVFGLIRMVVVSGLMIGVPAGAGWAQDSPFATGWDLQASASTLRFQSVKQTTKVESSSFATLTGGIEADGQARVRVLLDSVDTSIDLRNVRMRFMLFETFKFPEATISLSLDPGLIADLPTVRRKIVPVRYTLDLHGVVKTAEAEVAVTLLSDDLVSVASSAPISVAIADFGLEEGIARLEAAANVVIIPSATVTFDFLFARRGTSAATPAPVVPAEPASAALEVAGDFSLEACVGRFEILSRTGNIYFRPGSARLDDESRPLLDSVVAIVQRCPDLVIEVAGHTDSDGGDSANQRLSEARAAAVARYLSDGGIDAARMQVAGYGEARPVADNATPEGKGRNRRIEFTVVK